MKKTLLMLLLVTACGGATAQKAYQKLNMFQGDTVAYMKANFEDNKARYIGYPFEKLLNDYELPIEKSTTLGTSPWDGSQGGKSYLRGFVLSYIDYQHRELYDSKKKRHASVFVYFQGPYTELNYDVSDAILHEGFTKAAIIKRTGNYIVKEIKVSIWN